MTLKNRLLHAPLSAVIGLVALSASTALAAGDMRASQHMQRGDLSVSTSTQGGGFAPVRARETRILFHGPSMVMTGFSGARFIKPDGVTPSTLLEHQFIDLDGASASITNIDRIGFGMNGNEVKRPPYDRLLASQVGQVFGTAVDDAAQPNLYLAATSAFGLPVIGEDRDGDGIEDKLYSGRDDARFMDGLFGPNPENGPGSIWKVDGQTGQISLFASIALDGVPNSGPGLGNIAFDATSKQLFVSDLDTGMIFRLDMDGNQLESFDHGTTARSLEGLAPVAFDPANRLNIASPDFDVEDPDSWNYTAKERRVWGLATHGGRLYYAVADGPTVWSVGINPADGGFMFDARKEFALPDDVPSFEISDMVFAADGSLIISQRGERVASYDFSKNSKKRRAEVLRFVKSKRTGAWSPIPRSYAVGFANQFRGGTGGVALGPRYRKDGRIDNTACKATLWTSGESLRNRPDFAEVLSPGGALAIDGAQAQPFGISRDENSPPWISYHFDFDGKYPNRNMSGQVGDVEIVACRGKQEVADGGYDFFDPGVPPTYDDWWPCLDNPGLCTPPPEDRKECLKTRYELKCNKATGNYEMQLIATDDLSFGFDALDMDDPANLMTGLPVNTPFPTNVKFLTTGLLPGQIGQLDVCAYNSADKATGRPYNCCKASVVFRVPDENCSQGPVLLLKQQKKKGKAQ